MSQINNLDATAFTVSIGKKGVSTGISAFDRAKQSKVMIQIQQKILFLLDMFFL